MLCAPCFRHIRRLTSLLAALVVLLSVAQASARGVIRDAEIETVLRDIADPIFAAAGLHPESVETFIINDESLNAFVAGGQKLFLHTGLVMRSETPEQLAGVIAHETGHIAGGHLSRLQTASERAAAELLLGSVLGIAAAIAGAPQLGTAIIAGGTTVAERNFLSFSRAQEQAADQAAISYLERIDLPPKGLYEFFRILEGQNLRISGEGSEFLRTHPLTRDRLQFLEAQVAASPYRDRSFSSELHDRHDRMVAKLAGFLNEPARVFAAYPGDSAPDRYARAVAHFKNAEVDRALVLLDQLIVEQPDDPYLHELKGQILFESGRIAESIPAYERALAALPNSALVRLALARAYLERQDEELAEEAAILLREAVRIEPRNAMAWRFLGIAEGRLGDAAAASLALAEHAILTRNADDAGLHLARAEQRIPHGDARWLHLQDLKRAAESIEDEG